MKVKFIAIAALGKSRQIGLNGSLPWQVPEEYEFFKRTVKGQYVLIGRKNFEAHGSDVEGAYPLVLSRTPGYHHENALVFSSVLEATSYLDDAEVEVVYVMGGAEVYQETLPFVTEFLWSQMDYDGPADCYFPDFSQFSWTKISEEKHKDWKLTRLLKIPQKLY